jgi:ureidoglycolate dehydrogenase (NAD+)
MEAAKKAIELARNGGSGHIAVCNSSHFGAAAYYALEIARHGMIGLSFSNTDALIRTYAGKRPFLGNNPIAFTAPCDGEEPFCLDMATSVVTFNKIRQLRENGLKAPSSVGADSRGVETTDAGEIAMLLPIGGYKGYGISMMIEILCSLLTGMPYGPHIPKMFEAPMSQKRFLGQFIIAMRIDRFCGKSEFKKRLSMMMKELRNEPAMVKHIPVRVAGDPEKANSAERLKKGIPLGRKEYEAFKDIAEKYNIEFKPRADLYGR